MNQQLFEQVVDSKQQLGCIGDLLAYGGMRPYLGFDDAHPVVRLHRESAYWDSMNSDGLENMSKEFRQSFVRMAYKLCLETLRKTINQPGVSYGTWDHLLNHFILQALWGVKELFGEEIEQVSDTVEEFQKLYTVSRQYFNNIKDLGGYDEEVSSEMVAEMRSLVLVLLERPEMQFDLLTEVRKLEVLLRQRLEELLEEDKKG